MSLYKSSTADQVLLPPSRKYSWPNSLTTSTNNKPSPGLDLKPPVPFEYSQNGLVKYNSLKLFRARSDSLHDMKQVKERPKSLHLERTATPIPDPNGNLTTLAFVNKLSGDQRGETLYKQLKKKFSGDSQCVVYDVSSCNVTDVLANLKLARAQTENPSDLLILACGGDGTVWSVIQAVFEVNIEPRPKLGIIPIGSGNDISREYGWGKAFNPDDEDLEVRMNEIMNADLKPLDIWSVAISNRENPELKGTKVLYYCNYFNIGLDAEISMGFHSKRKNHPWAFGSRTGNKFWYMFYGAYSLSRSPLLTPDIISVVVDDKPKPLSLPTDARTLVLLNFKSYQNGVDLWWNSEIEKAHHKEEKRKTKKLEKLKSKLEKKEKKKEKKTQEEKLREKKELKSSVLIKEEDSTFIAKQSSSDGLVEVTTIAGPVHEAMVRLNLNHGVRLSQAKKIEIKTTVPLSVAVDGEPQRLDGPSRIVVNYAGQIQVLVPRISTIDFTK